MFTIEPAFHQARAGPLPTAATELQAISPVEREGDFTANEDVVFGAIHHGVAEADALVAELAAAPPRPTSPVLSSARRTCYRSARHVLSLSAR